MLPRPSSRPVVWLSALLAAGTILAACSNSPKAPSAASTTTTAAHQGNATTTTAVPATTTTTLPTSGPLSEGSAISVPLAAAQVVAAEGPDGTVFVAAQAPGSASPSIVYVVDGNGPAAIAEHISSGIAALAADTSNLYVATYSTVTAYSRSSGNQVQQWSLPPINAANSSNDDLVSMTAAAGKVFVLVTQGNTVSVLSINPSSAAAPASVAQGLGAAVASNGTVYYETSAHALTSVASGGATASGASLADSPNGLGGGVQYVNTVAGGAVWVAEPAGQGEDQQWSTFDASSLHQIAQFSGNVGQTVVDTLAGSLVLSTADAPSACAQQGQMGVGCVSRITTAGSLTAPVAATNAIALVGPYPVVIEANSGYTSLELFRLT